MTSPRLLYETHSHTTLCRHAHGEPDEYAQVAKDRGLLGLTITCHNPMPNDFSPRVRMALDEFDQYLQLVEETRKKWQGQVDVRLGIECDYFPGYEDWLVKQVASAPFDFVLGSIHPQCAEYRERFWTGDAIAFQKIYFDQLARAAELGIFDSLSHPDLIKNYKSRHWNPALIMDDICQALDRIAATGTAMELNTSGLNKTISEMNPFPAMLREMRARGIPVTVGADAHVPERVAADFEVALQLLAECGFEEIGFFLNRERQDVGSVLRWIHSWRSEFFRVQSLSIGQRSACPWADL